MPANMKGMIADAFVSLSAEKPIDKITVKDLVEKCGISRQTFYYHFQDILEVIEWSAEQAFQQLLERSLATDDLEAVLRDFICAAGDSGQVLQKLLHSQKREQIELLLVRSIRTYLQEMLLRRGPRPDIPYEDADTVLNFCTYGVVGLLLSDCAKKTADRGRLAHQMTQLLTGSIADGRHGTA